MGAEEVKPARRSRKRAAGLADSPQMVTIKDVAAKFGVSPASLRRWVRDREFAQPHMVIGSTWLFRADVIDHKLRTGSWPQGIKLAGDRIRGDRMEGIS